MHRTRTALAAIGSVALLALSYSPAHGAGLGPRVGLTDDPDQLHMGLQWHAADMTPQFSFVPSAELGIGSDVEVVSFNFDFRYRFAIRNSSWSPYAGGGPALHWTNTDSNDDTQVGLGVVGGIQTQMRSAAFFTELRLGMVDSPDLKFTVGWTFR